MDCDHCGHRCTGCGEGVGLAAFYLGLIVLLGVVIVAADYLRGWL